MLRHSVLWIMREPLSESARLRMLQRLAFLGTEPPRSVSSGDYGADLFGGSPTNRGTVATLLFFSTATKPAAR
jgi:hypothetical protein